MLPVLSLLFSTSMIKPSNRNRMSQATQIACYLVAYKRLTTLGGAGMRNDKRLIREGLNREKHRTIIANEKKNKRKT